MVRRKFGFIICNRYDACGDSNWELDGNLKPCTLDSLVCAEVNAIYPNATEFCTKGGGFAVVVAAGSEYCYDGVHGIGSEILGPGPKVLRSNIIDYLQKSYSDIHHRWTQMNGMVLWLGLASLFWYLSRRG